MANEHRRHDPMRAVAAFIVDKRKAFYLFYAGLAVFCLFSWGWVHVNNDLTTYLSEETETRQGLVIMAEEYPSFTSGRLMVDNLPYEEAAALAEEFGALDGVYTVAFDDTPEHYRDGAALFTILYAGEANDPACLDALETMRARLDGYDLSVTGDVGVSLTDILAKEVAQVMIVAVVIILLVLLFSSRTYMEIPVLIITFVMAALLNMGTNFLFGTISFVSNSVAIVLQLALAIDYAIILCHRYTEERETKDAREAVICALSAAIPEISGSSLTTLAGLAAMCFMQFRIGYDMGIVLMKSIVCSMLSVFTLMPGLLMSFSSLIDRSHHRSFVPKISFWGRMTVKTRFVVPPLFALLLVAAFIFSGRCPYVFGYSTLKTVTRNESQLAEERINETFGTENNLAMLVPKGDYETEARLLRDLEAMDEISSVTGLANVEAAEGVMLTERLTPRQFAELTDLDVEAARLLYSAYAVEQGTYGRLVSGLDGYAVPLLDMFLFVYDQVQEGLVTPEGALAAQLEELHGQLAAALPQLRSEHYSRFVLTLDMPVESEDTFALLDRLHETAARYYEKDVYLVGNSTSTRDLAASFAGDNLLINILTIVFVIVILIFTFQSAGLPVLLILVIQGSIWINFSFPYLTGSNLFFMSYLVISAIQMGANIDYAIVITNRYTHLRRELPRKEAVVQALNHAFPTVITSGTIMASAGILIGLMSSEPTISSIGLCLGRGTIISILLVMGVLPQLLLLGDWLIEHTAFTIPYPAAPVERSGLMRLDGHLRGSVSGTVDGYFRGTLNGTLNASVESARGEEPPEGEEAAP